MSASFVTPSHYPSCIRPTVEGVQKKNELTASVVCDYMGDRRGPVPAHQPKEGIRLMDGKRFDYLTKALARGVPRRTALKGLGSAFLGIALGSAERRTSAAAIARNRPVQLTPFSGPRRRLASSGIAGAQSIRLVFLGQYLKRFPTAPSNVRKTQLLGAYLRSLNADYVFSDTEEAIITPGAAINNSTPSIAPDLVFDIMRDEYGISLAVVSNNHIFDQGESGFRNTLQQLRDRGIPFAGGGNNLDEASMPIVLPLRNSSRTLALHAVVSAPTLNQFDGIVTTDVPGYGHAEAAASNHVQTIARCGAGSLTAARRCGQCVAASGSRSL